MVLLLFYAFAALAVVSAMGVIFASKPARALLSLVVTMFALSGIYLLFGAPFIAMVNLIVYAGAVLVLFLFVIMLQGIGAGDWPLSQRFNLLYRVLTFFTGAAFLTALGILFAATRLSAASGVEGTAAALGRLIFGHYHLPFELTALLLILGILAAVALAAKEEAS
ncbi:MAG: NADH-quinone oxidoreductase subunit J [Candidatus Omnitrophota bacterium]|jgi:NADH-quinone oxidoreductase subunit J